MVPSEYGRLFRRRQNGQNEKQISHHTTTDQSPHYNRSVTTLQRQDVRSFTLTNLRIFKTCCLLTATTLPTVKLLHFTYGTLRFYNGDCEGYVPLDVTIYYLTEIHPTLEGTYYLNLYVPWKHTKISITPRDFTFHSTVIYLCGVF